MEQGWRFLSSLSSLCSSLLKAIYFPNNSNLEARRGSRPSWVWSSILEGCEILSKGSRRNIGNGKSMSIWKDKWVPIVEDFKISFNLVFGNSFSLVELINQRESGWDSSLLNSLFSAGEAKVILSIPISVTDCPDSLVWHWSSKGSYMVKLAIGWFLIISVRVILGELRLPFFFWFVNSGSVFVILKLPKKWCTFCGRSFKMPFILRKISSIENAARPALPNSLLKLSLWNTFFLDATGFSVLGEVRVRQNSFKQLCFGCSLGRIVTNLVQI